MDYETTWTPCCRIWPPDCLILSTKWSHWRQQMPKFQTGFQNPLSSFIWPELFRCAVFYTQLLVHLLQLFFCWSFVFLANPTTWKNSCLCSHSKYCSVAGAILVFGNQSTLMRSTTAQLWQPRPLYKYLAGSYSITGLCVCSASRSS